MVGALQNTEKNNTQWGFNNNQWGFIIPGRLQGCRVKEHSNRKSPIHIYIYVNRFQWEKTVKTQDVPLPCLITKGYINPSHFLQLPFQLVFLNIPHFIVATFKQPAKIVASTVCYIVLPCCFGIINPSTKLVSVGQNPIVHAQKKRGN